MSLFCRTICNPDEEPADGMPEAGAEAERRDCAEDYRAEAGHSADAAADSAPTSASAAATAVPACPATAAAAAHHCGESPACGQ